MDTEEKNGGPAFPHVCLYKQNGYGVLESEVDYPGMSLRDYFATAALKGAVYQQCMYSPEFGYRSYEQVAETCYKYANAMLAERAKP